MVRPGRLGAEGRLVRREVFQIAAHEDHFGLKRLLQVCEVAKELTTPLNITRVIARPFVGDSSDNYQRTGNRKDLTTEPIEPPINPKSIQAITILLPFTGP